MECCLVVATVGDLAWWTFIFPHTWIGLWLIVEILRAIFNYEIMTITSSQVLVQVTPLSYNCCFHTKSYTLADPTFQKVCLKRKDVHDDEDNTDTTWYFVAIMRRNGTCDQIAVVASLDVALFYFREIARFVAGDGNVVV